MPGFTISEVEKEFSGTSITLYLNDEGKEFANKWRIDNIIKKYSNHVSFPIFLHYDEKVSSDDKSLIDF